MKRLNQIWSSTKLFSAIGLCLITLTNAQSVSYSADSPSQIYQPLINVLYPVTNQSEAKSSMARINPSPNGWTPVISGKTGAQLNSVYTAINPSPAGSPSLQEAYVMPISSKYTVSSVAPSPINQHASTVPNVNSSYLASESIARNSYQKPQKTYMIQPAKYQQAFASSSNKNSSKSSLKSSNRKTVKNNKILATEMIPIPMIKPHRHGATLGFNLPDQGLTLYLDINELATKPMAQNIGLKVVSHGKESDGSSEEEDVDQNDNSIESLNKVKQDLESSKPNASKSLRKRVTKVVKKIRSNSSNTNKNVIKKLNIQSKSSTNGTKLSKLSVKSKPFGTGNTLNIPSPVQAHKAKVIEISGKNHAINLNADKVFDDGKPKMVLFNRTDIPPSASRIPATYVTQVEYAEEGGTNADKNPIIQQKKEGETSEEEENESDILKKSNTSAENLDEVEQEKPLVDLSDDEEEDTETETSVNDSDADNVESLPDVEPDEDSDEEEEEEEENELIPTTTAAPGLEGNVETTTLSWSSDTKGGASNSDSFSSSVFTTSAPIFENQMASNGASNSNQQQVEKQEMLDNKLVQQMQNLLEKSAKLIDLTSNTCTAKNRCKRSSIHTCEPNFESITSNTSTTVREIAQQLEANLLLNEVTTMFENELQDFMDFSTSGYTIILPSNQAVRRLPPNLLKQWKRNSDSLSLDAYLIEGAHSLESMVASKMIRTRNRMKLHINNPHNETYTINGQRVVQANQKAPSGGIVHVIDGLLYPNSDKDIMDTLKSCGRLDGFVTLAEGTGFASTLKQDGPFTLFVPSNDALQKVPDNDLDMIRRNMTALKEFLMYHVAQGVFYSQDLVDGQFLPSVLEGEYLQAGVRVDGCSRRLVEVNVSPLYRADIPASNGVIHVVDWILKPDDRDWCNGVILPRRR